MKKRLRPHWFYVAGLVPLCVVVVMVFGSRSTAPVEPVTFLLKPYRMPASRVFPLARWIPHTSSWSWLWRVKDSVFGRPKPVNLQISVIEVADSAQLIASHFSLAHPMAAQSNGLRVWLLPDPELDQLRRQLKNDEANRFVNSARISTADEIAASLFTGETIVVKGSTNSVGLGVEVFPRVQRDSTDLTARILFSEAVTNLHLAGLEATSTAGISILTNLDVAARFQIPETGGVFLVNSGRAGTNGKSTALILSAKQPGKK